MNKQIELIIKKKDYVIKSFMFDIIKNQKLTLNDTLLLIFFLNQEKPILDLNLIKETIYLSEVEIMEAFNNLSKKQLIKTDIIKINEKIEEQVNTDNIYKLAYLNLTEKSKEETTSDIFSSFEQEFGRTLSPMEYELISAWISSGINEELILGALKEATYNGVSNLRYIDKIIYEWGKKGFKTMEDVNKHLKEKNHNKDLALDNFDYNWLDDDE